MISPFKADERRECAMGAGDSMTGERQETAVWKWVAILAVMAAAWLSGVMLQATAHILPSGCACNGGCGMSREGVVELHRRIARLEGEQASEEREITRLRQDFDKHLNGRGLGTPATAPKP
ncbi:MAG: hypothetical protein U0903_00800 [Planctomycetales bacterium]